MKTTKQTEQELRNALMNWAVDADSTPSEPEQGVELTYQANDGTLGFWVDFYDRDFEDLPNVEIKNGDLYHHGKLGDLYHHGKLVEDPVEAEELIGYNTIVDEIMYDLKGGLKGCEEYTEENVKGFINYLKN